MLRPLNHSSLDPVRHRLYERIHSQERRRNAPRSPWWSVWDSACSCWPRASLCGNTSHPTKPLIPVLPEGDPHSILLTFFGDFSCTGTSPFLAHFGKQFGVSGAWGMGCFSCSWLSKPADAWSVDVFIACDFFFSGHFNWRALKKQSYWEMARRFVPADTFQLQLMQDCGCKRAHVIPAPLCQPGKS